MALERMTVTEGTEELSALAHGMLFSLHLLGTYYNARRGKPFQAAVHASVAVYDLVCSAKHSKSRNNLRENGGEYLGRLRNAGM